MPKVKVGHNKMYYEIHGQGEPLVRKNSLHLFMQEHFDESIENYRTFTNLRRLPVLDKSAYPFL
jgi:hypothetical protein